MGMETCPYFTKVSSYVSWSSCFSTLALIFPLSKRFSRLAVLLVGILSRHPFRVWLEMCFKKCGVSEDEEGYWLSSQGVKKI